LFSSPTLLTRSLFSPLLLSYSLPLLLLLSFSSSADHRDLHSFPTRRSSDLWRPGRRSPCRSAGDHRPARARGAHRGHGRLRTQRSEEHTSELQSRFDLVCRLLLEKKKQTDLP